MNNDSRENFGSKIGAVLAAAGSAVGLGNIWRFPIETGQNGGAAFIIVYIGCVLLLGAVGERISKMKEALSLYEGKAV